MNLLKCFNISLPPFLLYFCPCKKIVFRKPGGAPSGSPSGSPGKAPSGTPTRAPCGAPSGSPTISELQLH